MRDQAEQSKTSLFCCSLLFALYIYIHFHAADMGAVSLLVSLESKSHIHLIVGSNSLAAARCTKSLEVGAKPLLITPGTTELPSTLGQRVDNGEVEWLKKSFEDEDVLRLGRDEVNGVVDAVFVTSGQQNPLSMLAFLLLIDKR